MIRQLVVLGTCAVISAIKAQSALATVVISSDPTQNMSCSAGQCVPTGHHPILNVSDLAAMLESSDVIVYARCCKRSDSGIELTAPLSWASSHKLTLQGADSRFSPIRVGSTIVVAGHSALTVGGELKIDPGASITFWDTASTLTVDFTTYQLASDLPTLVSDIAANPSGAFALANDYDAHSDSFRKSPIPLLQGQLTGLGHTISNLTVTHGDHSCEGFVAVTGYGSTAVDLSLHNVNVVSDGKSRNVGGVVGCSSGYLSNVAVDGAVSGIADANVGGIAGENTTQTSINNAISSASVTGGQAGGLVGESNGQISGSSASGAVVGSINAGGLVGSNNSTVYDSYATGAASGTNNVGGLAGSNHGDVRYSYSRGSVSGNADAIGGLVGFNVGSIDESYSIGAVSGSQGFIGGFVGSDPNETISFGYWDTETSGISNPAQGAGSPANDPGIEGLTSAQLQTKLPYGFDKRTWRLKSGVNGGYPYLNFNPSQ